MAAVRLAEITKRYGDTTAVNGVSMTIQDGEFFSLLGPSGCGKSTLLNVIAGLVEHDGGAIYIDDADVGSRPPRDRQIAMVFQDYALYPHMTVRENLEFPLKAGRGLTRPERQDRIDEVLELLDIPELGHRLPKELSGGQRQRVAVGRALVREPKVFLMDEPLSNLDARLRVQMRRELQRLHKRLNATIIYVTHDQAEAMSVSDRIAVMSDGVLQQVGAPKDIYDRPAKRFVANFLGIVPMTQIEGRIRFDGEHAWFHTDHLRYRLPPQYDGVSEQLANDQEVCLGIHPEHVHVAEQPSTDTFPAKLDIRDQLGSDQYLLFDVYGSTVVSRVPPDYQIADRAQVHVRFDADRVYLFDGETGLNVLTGAEPRDRQQEPV